MAKEKNKVEVLNNNLQPRKKILEMTFIGTNGRFGFTEKLWKDFSFDELVEFYTAHNKKTRDFHLTGSIPANYQSPFEENLPLKPTEDEE